MSTTTLLSSRGCTNPSFSVIVQQLRVQQFKYFLIFLNDTAWLANELAVQCLPWRGSQLIQLIPIQFGESLPVSSCLIHKCNNFFSSTHL